MDKRELIKAEIEKLGEEDLQKVYSLIIRFKELREIGQKNLMAILREIRNDAPSVFARNLDLYLRGEKVITEPEAEE